MADDTVMVWNVDTEEPMEVSRAEAAAGMVRYARTLGPGTAACGEVERQALNLLRDTEE
jgi:hypothetical protein